MSSQCQRLQEDRLRQLLNAYFLHYGPGRITDEIEGVVLAYLYGQPLHLSGHHMPLSDDLESLLIALGITYERHSGRVVSGSPLYLSLMSIREADWEELPKMVSILLQRNLDELNSRSPLDIKGIGAVWLLSLSDDIQQYDERHDILNERVRNRLLMKRGDFVDSGGLRMSYTISNPLLMYLGCEVTTPRVQQYSTEVTRDEIIVDCGTTENHYPIARRLRCAVRDVYSVARNICYFMKNRGKESDPKVIRCLEYRLKGKQEDEISAKLGFKDSEEYQAWLESNHINITASVPDTSYEDWLEARQVLLSGEWKMPSGAAKVKSDADAENDGSSDRAAEDTDEGRQSNVFSHSPDYRSVWLRGEEIVLSSQEADVVRLLHEQYLNLTPEVGLGWIIEEVSPNTSNKRLRDVFKNDEARVKLIAKGKKKDTLRLNID